MEKIPKKKAKKTAKKVGVPAFSADINLDEEEPDIPEKAEKVEVDELSIIRKINSKSEGQLNGEVKVEKPMPFCIQAVDEKAKIEEIRIEAVPEEVSANVSANVSTGLVQSVILQDSTEPMLITYPAEQQKKPQENRKQQPQEDQKSHVIQPVEIQQRIKPKQVEPIPQQQSKKIQQQSTIKKKTVEDDDQDQIVLSLTDDHKSKAKAKKSTKKATKKSKTGKSTVFAVESIIDLEDQPEEAKVSSSIVAQVQEKKVESANVMEVKEQIIKISQPVIQQIPVVQEITNKIPDTQQQQAVVQPYVHEEVVSKETVVVQIPFEEHISQPEQKEEVKEEPIVKQQPKVQAKEEQSIKNVEEIQSEIVVSLEDSKPKAKSTKKVSKKTKAKPKVEKNLQMLGDNILELEEETHENVAVTKPVQEIPQIDLIPKNDEEVKEEITEKIEEKVKVEEIEPIHVQIQQKPEQIIELPQQLLPQPIPKETIISQIQEKQVFEEPIVEYKKEQVSILTKIQEDEDLIVVSLNDPKPKLNKTSKKQTKKGKGKIKEQKNAMISEDILAFQTQVKVQQPPKQQKKIEKKEIAEKVIQFREVVEQVKQEVREQIIPTIQPQQFIEQTPQQPHTKSVQRPSPPPAAPSEPLVPPPPSAKKEIVNELISLIRFHNDEEIKSMRQRMQMLQQDILSRMCRSKGPSMRSPSRSPDYEWIVEQNIALRGQYKSLNKN